MKTSCELINEVLQHVHDKSFKINYKTTGLAHTRRAGLLVGPHADYVDLPCCTDHENKKIMGQDAADLTMDMMKIDGIKTKIIIMSMVNESFYVHKEKFIEGMEILNELNTVKFYPFDKKLTQDLRKDALRTL